MQISEVRAALAAAAGDATSDPPLLALGYVPDNILAPCVYVDDIDIDCNWTHGGDDKVDFTLRVLVSRTDDEAAQKLLDGYLSRTGAASIRAALLAARGIPGEAALGGLCDDFNVSKIAGYRWYEHAGVKYVGAEIKVTAYGDGD